MANILSSGMLNKIISLTKSSLRKCSKPEIRAYWYLLNSIGKLPRFHPGQIDIWGWKLNFVDAASLISAFNYIVVKRWNDFETDNPSPFIIDCGANIGISVLHFKRLFPNAIIIAFEPDHKICEILKNNLYRNNVKGVHVVEAALWDTEGEVHFLPDGADAGRIIRRGNNNNIPKVRSTCLSKFIDKPVDLLKMDIEGAEAIVFKECDDKLDNVSRIVLEYHVISKKKSDLAQIISILDKHEFVYYLNTDSDWIDFSNPPRAYEDWLNQYYMIYAQRNWKI